MHRGYIKLWRKSLLSDVWQNPDLSRTWICCLMLANHKEKHVTVDGILAPIKCYPGEFITGRYSFHEAMFPKKSKKNPSPITVWRWLGTLKSIGNLNIESNKRYSKVSIINWGIYQSGDQPNDQPSDQEVINRRSTDDQQTITNKNVKNVKNEKNNKQNENLNDFENDKSFAIRRIIKNLSEKTGQKFNPQIHATESAVCEVLKFYNEPEIMKTVDFMIREWGNSIEMKKHLNPGTLFAPDKFEKYFNQANQVYKRKPLKKFVDKGLLQNDPVITDRMYRENPDLAAKHKYDLSRPPL